MQWEVVGDLEQGEARQIDAWEKEARVQGFQVRTMPSCAKVLAAEGVSSRSNLKAEPMRPGVG